MDISVILCTYNRSASLRRTLQSFKEIVTPEGLSWELIVVDNNSTDKTREIFEEYIKEAESLFNL